MWSEEFLMGLLGIRNESGQPEVRRPQPKAEILITRPYSFTPVVIIQCASPDAAQFVEKHAPRFGRMGQYNDTLIATYLLTVSELYNIDEVVAYLAAMQDEG